LSAGKDKRENFERLLREGKLGGLAVLRNLRLMLASGVDPKLIRERLDKGVTFRSWRTRSKRPCSRASPDSRSLQARPDSSWTCPAR
jgi:hypothetical protein